MSSTRCAACNYLRRRCASDCIFSPYFPPNDPQRFTCVHKIYGAGNIRRMLLELPVHLRAEAADSMYHEAQWRIKDPVYGCVGMIHILQDQINNAQTQLAQAQADIAFLKAQFQYHHRVEAPPPPPSHASSSSNPWFF